MHGVGAGSCWRCRGSGASSTVAIAELQHVIAVLAAWRSKLSATAWVSDRSPAGTLSAVSLIRLLYRWSSIVQSNELQRLNLRSPPVVGMFSDIPIAGGPRSPAPSSRWASSMNQNQSSAALRRVAPMALFQLRAQQKCRACGHRVGEHVGFPDAELAKQLARIHGGCLDCESCADE